MSKVDGNLKLGDYYTIVLNFYIDDTSDGFPDSSDVDSDGSWKQMLQLRGTSRQAQGRQTKKTAPSVKQKNIKKMQNAMFLSYHHNDGEFGILL